MKKFGTAGAIHVLDYARVPREKHTPPLYARPAWETKTRFAAMFCQPAAASRSK